MITNKTKEFYPDLEGAELLEFTDPRIPEGVRIIKNNVVVSRKGVLKISRFGPTWSWRAGHSFHGNFSSPEEALKHYLETFHG